MKGEYNGEAFSRKATIDTYTDDIIQVDYERGLNEELQCEGPEVLERAIAEQALRGYFDGFLPLDESRVESMFAEEHQLLKERIIGQPQAIEAIIDALDTTAIRPIDDHRPRASFAFLGPTGTGKTETAKVLADLLKAKNGKARLVQIDCAQYAQSHQAVGLIGPPPSYVGYEKYDPVLSPRQIGQDDRQTTIVLFDEIEKGHEKLHAILLAIMSEGRITLTNNTVTNFRNTIVIMTSNLGAREMNTAVTPKRNIGFSNNNFKPEVVKDRQDLDEIAKNAFNQAFTPEFQNRLTKKIVFRPHTQEGLAKIIDLHVERLNKTYTYFHGVKLELSDRAKEEIVAKAQQESSFGAREIKRVVDGEIQKRLNKLIISSKNGNVSGLPDGSLVRVFHRSEFESEKVEPYLTAADQFIFMARHDDSALSAKEISQREKIAEELDKQEGKKLNCVATKVVFF